MRYKIKGEFKVIFHFAIASFTIGLLGHVIEVLSNGVIERGEYFFAWVIVISLLYAVSSFELEREDPQ